MELVVLSVSEGSGPSTLAGMDCVARMLHFVQHDKPGMVCGETWSRTRPGVAFLAKGTAGMDDRRPVGALRPNKNMDR